MAEVRKLGGNRKRRREKKCRIATKGGRQYDDPSKGYIEKGARKEKEGGIGRDIGGIKKGPIAKYAFATEEKGRGGNALPKKEERSPERLKSASVLL